MSYDVKPEACNHIFETADADLTQARTCRSKIETDALDLRGALKHPGVIAALGGAVDEVLAPHLATAEARWASAIAAGRESVRLYGLGNDQMARDAARTAGNLPDGFVNRKIR